jgi:hypothetical protein
MYYVFLDPSVPSGVKSEPLPKTPEAVRGSGVHLTPTIPFQGRRIGIPQRNRMTLGTIIVSFGRRLFAGRKRWLLCLAIFGKQRDDDNRVGRSTKKISLINFLASLNGGPHPRLNEVLARHENGSITATSQRCNLSTCHSSRSRVKLLSPG